MMGEDGSSTAQALRRIAHYLEVPIESLFGYPDEVTSFDCERIPTAEVRELLIAFTKLDDVGARRRVIDAAAAEVRLERESTKQKKLSR